jgi:hypothetical protein
MRRALVLAILFAVACSPEPSGTVVEIPPPAAPPLPTVTAQVVLPPPSPPVALRSGDEWVGTYTCAQGETDLALHVSRVWGDNVEAVFDFSHGPSGAAGAYEMRGTVGPGGEVTLEPGPWLRHPSGYVSVGMHGTARGDAFSGRIENSSCGGFSLRRR